MISGMVVVLLSDEGHTTLKLCLSRLSCSDRQNYAISRYTCTAGWASLDSFAIVFSAFKSSAIRYIHLVWDGGINKKKWMGKRDLRTLLWTLDY